MNIIINPGSGPVEGATLENAAANMVQFIADSVEKSAVPVTYSVAPSHGHDEGRFLFNVSNSEGRTVEVEMPGIPLEQVRWMDEPNQNIWDFPRLYVDGSSWVWKFALLSDTDFQTDDEDAAEEWS